MKKVLLAITAATMGGAALAAPLNLDFSQAYVAGMGSYLITDSARPDRSGAGAQLVAGVPLNGMVNLEATLFGHALDRRTNDASDSAYGLGVDALLLQPYQRVTGFALAGLGVIHEDIGHTQSTAPYLNVGLGLMAPLPWVPALSVRGEVRGIYDINDKAAPGANKDSVLETRINIGLQYRFGGGSTRVAQAIPVAAAPADGDGDGVVDDADLCPNTPPGAKVDANGCPAAPVDSDGDGVVDTLDQCPDTPTGTVVDSTGCVPVAPPAPIAKANTDEDGDGVPNELDKCPGTPPSFKVDGTGCLIEQTVTLQNVNFEQASGRLTDSAKHVLDGIAESLLAQTSVKLAITGHTDSLGPQSYNLSLSQRRAKAVLDYLVEKGVPADRLSADGEGEFSPIASNDTEEGRAKNRRVEFRVSAE